MTSAQLEELDYRKLYAAYSSGGRKSITDPRVIFVEGAFGLLKNDFSFRRFMTTGKRNIRIELFFLTLGFNLKKRWMKQQKSRLETHYSEKKAS